MTISGRVEERSYLIPRRVLTAFNIIGVIAREGTVTAERLVEVTGFSKAYIKVMCIGLKRYGITANKRGLNGGYSLVNSIEETTVGDVLDALSKTEDRDAITIALYDFLITKAKTITLDSLIEVA